MLTTLNYKTDNEHNLKNGNDALIKAPGSKREKQNKTNVCFITEAAQKSPLETITILQGYCKSHFPYADSETWVL